MQREKVEVKPTFMADLFLFMSISMIFFSLLNLLIAVFPMKSALKLFQNNVISYFFVSITAIAVQYLARKFIKKTSTAFFVLILSFMTTEIILSVVSKGN